MVCEDYAALAYIGGVIGGIAFGYFVWRKR